MQSRIPRGVGSDSLCWGLNGSGKFDTKSFYHKIQVASTSFFPWNGIWKVVHSLWVHILQLFGIHWVMPGFATDLLFSW